MDITILKNGALRLSIQSLTLEERQDLHERAQELDEISFLREAMEPYWTNGSFAPFDSGQGNPFVGLTEAPCIAESMVPDDKGDLTAQGRIWWFPNYAVESLVDTLFEKGQVDFPLGIEAQPSMEGPRARSPKF